MNRRKILMPVHLPERFRIRRNHKDALFVRLFGSREKLLLLYNALNHSDYRDANVLEINTLDNFIYMGIKNDVSFIIGSYLNLYEHQSTFCPNMPVRGLMYFAGLYKAYIEMHDLNINGTKLVSLPTPQYIIFYNGTQNYADVKELRLSDSFKQGNGCLEVVATMYNINLGHNRELMEQCKLLEEYAVFIDKIRKYENQGMPVAEAVDTACRECISQNILRAFLLKNRSEVEDMFMADYDPKRQRRLDRRDAYNDGKADGITQGMACGRKEERDRVNKLNRRLAEENRTEDILKAAKDKEYQDKLFTEFDL